jgi:hypothetical protein
MEFRDQIPVAILQQRRVRFSSKVPERSPPTA